MFNAPPVQAWEYLIETKCSVVTAFKLQTMQPMISRHNPQTRNISTCDPPDLDRMDLEAFVDNIDGMASAALSTVTQEVWVSISELLFSICLWVYSRITILPLISLKFKHLITQASSYLETLVHLRSWLRFRWFTPISRDWTFLVNLWAYSRCYSHHNSDIFPLAPQEPFVHTSTMPWPNFIHPECSWTSQYGNCSRACQSLVHQIYGGCNICPMSISLSLVNGLQFDPPDLPHIAVPISGMLSFRDNSG